MEMLEKVELVREKTGVSYQEAKDALEACEYDVLDAIIWLENSGKTQTRTATFETSGTSTQTVSEEMVQAQSDYRKQSRKTKIGEVGGSIFATFRKLIRAGLDMTFVAERRDERVVTLPLLFVVLGLLFWGASLWLLVLGLFFGFRYHIEGASPVTIDVNDAMNKAADAAESIKSDFTRDEDE